MLAPDRPERAQALSNKLVQRIQQFIEDQEITPGEHLGEASLAAHLHVSRTPIRAALKTLARFGVVEHYPNRGYFLRTAVPEFRLPAVSDEDNSSYFRIAEDRLAGLLPDRVTERDLLRRYHVTHTQLLRLLGRMTQEGWAERLPGRGWRFLPVLNTEDGYVQMFQFRIVIEPSALMLPGYSLSPALIEKLRRQQQNLLGSPPEHYTRAELFQVGSFFHEAIVSGARNDLMTESIRRVNQLRRLMDYRYRITSRPARIAQECEEHLHLLDLIEQGDLRQASAYLREHLESALHRKTGLTASPG